MLRFGPGSGHNVHQRAWKMRNGLIEYSVGGLKVHQCISFGAHNSVAHPHSFADTSVHLNASIKDYCASAIRINRKSCRDSRFFSADSHLESWCVFSSWGSETCFEFHRKQFQSCMWFINYFIFLVSLTRQFQVPETSMEERFKTISSKPHDSLNLEDGQRRVRRVILTKIKQQRHYVH